MVFVTGFLIWLVAGIAAGLLVPALYRGPTTTAQISLVFGVLGAFIGGMLGTAPYITHDPNPLRIGSLIGALLGAAFFTWLYHLAARKFI